MFGFDDAAQMGLGAINTGFQIFGANQQARYASKMAALQRAQAERHYKNDMLNLQLEGEDTNRKSYWQNQANRDNIADQQGVGGSFQRVSHDRLMGERDRRLEALDRQGKMMTADWIDQQKMWDLQDKSAKSQQLMSAISGLLMQGASGAGGLISANNSPRT